MINIPENIRDAIRSASTRTGVSEELLTGIAYIESNFKPGVINGTQLSPTQVSGLFQITGDTWKGVRKDGTKKTLDINEQAYTAALLLKSLSDKYNGNKTLIAIAYNAGEGVSEQLKSKQTITYEDIKKAVQKFDGKAGFGPNKVQEVFQYPQKLAAAMGEQSTITGSVSINPLNETSKDNSVSTPPVAVANKFNDKLSVIENFTINDAGKTLDTFNKTVEQTAYMKNTKLVKRLRNGIARNKTLNTPTYHYGKKV